MSDDKIIEEPPDGAMLFGRLADHHSAGKFWHRDDREGHGDPVDDPMHWWSHDGRCWVSWGHIKRVAAKWPLELIVVAPVVSADSGGYQRAIDDLRAAPTFEASDIQWWGVPGDAFVTPSDYLEALAASRATKEGAGDGEA